LPRRNPQGKFFQKGFLAVQLQKSACAPDCSSKIEMRPATNLAAGNLFKRSGFRQNPRSD